MIFDTVMRVHPEVDLAGHVERGTRADAFSRYLTLMISCAHTMRAEIGDYLIEGVDVAPEIVATLPLADVRAVFLGMSRVTVARLLATGRPDSYLHQMREDEQQAFVDRLVEISARVEDRCRRYGFRYVDLSERYDEQLEAAYRALVIE